MIRSADNVLSPAQLLAEDATQLSPEWQKRNLLVVRPAIPLACASIGATPRKPGHEPNQRPGQRPDPSHAKGNLYPMHQTHAPQSFFAITNRAKCSNDRS